MEWRDQGILLGTRRHGETSVIIEVFTPERGRHAGVVRGGTSRRMAPVLQPGAQLDVEWRARLEDHLGTFRVEPLKSRAWAMSDRLALAACMRSSRQKISEEDVARIERPVLVAVGTKDDIAGSPQKLAALIPNAEVLEIPGRDHMVAVGDKVHKQGVLEFLHRADA